MRGHVDHLARRSGRLGLLHRPKELRLSFWPWARSAPPAKAASQAAAAVIPRPASSWGLSWWTTQRCPKHATELALHRSIDASLLPIDWVHRGESEPCVQCSFDMVLIRSCIGQLVASDSRMLGGSSGHTYHPRYQTDGLGRCCLDCGTRWHAEYQRFLKVVCVSSSIVWARKWVVGRSCTAAQGLLYRSWACAHQNQR